MIPLTDAERAVYYPADRRFRIWIRPSALILFAVLVLIPLSLAWAQARWWGLPFIAPNPAAIPGAATGPHGFPAWIRWCHFFNLFFIFMLIRSGLSILMDHPRLYFNDGCTPGSEWIRFTPLKVPKDRLWTAKDDNRYISPVVGLPGYSHSIGIGRCWHFLNVYGFVLTGLFFVSGLLTSNQWERLVPTSWAVFVQAWNTFVYYANFHLPPEPNGFYGYNALQQLVLLCHHLHHGSARDPHWNGHVAGTGESLSALRTHLSRPSGSALHSFSCAGRVRRLHHRSCHVGGAHRLPPQHEPHRARSR